MLSTASHTGLPKAHDVPWDTHINLVHPDDHEETLRVGAECNRKGTAGQAAFRIRNAQGEYRWFLSRLEPLRSPNGTLLYWIGINLDIEELKRAEEQLRQSTQELKRSEFYLTEGQRLAHMGSWAFKAAGFDHWSAELFQIHGLDPNGKPPTVEEYLDTVHPEDREFMKQAIEKVLADHREFDFTKRIVRPDGKIRAVRCVGVPVIQGETFQGFVGTGMDVTE